MPTKRTSRPDPEAALHLDAQALHSALSHLVRVYQFRDRDKICCYDISVTQCHALEVLVERGPLRSVALADGLKLDKSTTSRVVDALLRKGYVQKLADAEDARAVLLRVTREGRALYERINGELIAQQAELIRGLDAEIRAGATEVIRRLARAAEDRFISGMSVGSCEPTCADGAGDAPSCA
ncbi:MarR family winged helix-turn-helix transcriptional regulator [Aquimonas sp.]|jgi:MarR family 2-MHQ and catechol resistance regulon transcriptional repressor|uniref:MarR family winged helix-turn-helix transcriptional regulator n=1 Tax=Aquimonas sp. TaxID=1872588 RepID=UPI0037BE23ED